MEGSMMALLHILLLPLGYPGRWQNLLLIVFPDRYSSVHGALRKMKIKDTFTTVNNQFSFDQKIL
jgi:hypothetical protein